MSYRRRGWYGNSQGHAMAARGVRLYAKKTPVMMRPLFYAQRAEQQAPVFEVREDVRNGLTFSEIRQKYPNADSDTLMKRGREAIDSLNGNSMMSDLSSPSHGVDQLVQERPEIRSRVVEVLKNRQMRSFLPQPKVEALERRMTA